MAKLSRDHSEIIIMFIWKKETFIQQVAKYTLNCSKIHYMLLKISIKCCLLYFLFINYINHLYQLLKTVCIISDNENHY